jgi:outer membrane lipoprotein-sorting protein
MKVLSLIVFIVIYATCCYGITADKVLKEAEKIRNPSIFKARFIIKDKFKGKERILKLNTYRKMDKFLAIFTYPIREKGRVILRRGEDMWMYLPSVGREIRVSLKQAMMATQFSHGDILRLDLLNDYTPKILGTETDCYILELKAKNKKTTYARIKYWIKIFDFMPIREEFFSLSGKLLKRLEYKEPKILAGKKRPTLFVMESMLKKGLITYLIIENMETRIDLSDRIFRKEYMKRAR